MLVANVGAQRFELFLGAVGGEVGDLRLEAAGVGRGGVDDLAAELEDRVRLVLQFAREALRIGIQPDLQERLPGRPGVFEFCRKFMGIQCSLTRGRVRRMSRRARARKRCAKSPAPPCGASGAGSCTSGVPVYRLRTVPVRPACPSGCPRRRPAQRHQRAVVLVDVGLHGLGRAAQAGGELLDRSRPVDARPGRGRHCARRARARRSSRPAPARADRWFQAVRSLRAGPACSAAGPGRPAGGALDAGRPHAQPRGELAAVGGQHGIGAHFRDAAGRFHADAQLGQARSRPARSSRARRTGCAARPRPA